MLNEKLKARPLGLACFSGSPKRTDLAQVVADLENILDIRDLVDVSKRDRYLPRTDSASFISYCLLEL
jgi:hypothetical protein